MWPISKISKVCLNFHSFRIKNTLIRTGIISFFLNTTFTQKTWVKLKALEQRISKKMEKINSYKSYFLSLEDNSIKMTSNTKFVWKVVFQTSFLKTKSFLWNLALFHALPEEQELLEIVKLIILRQYFEHLCGNFWQGWKLGPWKRDGGTDNERGSSVIHLPRQRGIFKNFDQLIK